MDNADRSAHSWIGLLSRGHCPSGFSVHSYTQMSTEGALMVMSGRGWTWAER